MPKKAILAQQFFAKEEALSVRYGLGIETHDQEGRVITLEYPEFFHGHLLHTKLTS